MPPRQFTTAVAIRIAGRVESHHSEIPERHTLVIPITILSLLPAMPLAAQDRYLEPPAAIARILDAPMTPAVSVSPTRDWLLLMERRSLPGISEVAAPDLRLAGIRLDPRANGPWRAPGYTGLPAPGEPQAARLRIAFLAGAAADGAAVLPMLFPTLLGLLWGLPDPSPAFRLALGYGASLMLGWTALLLWAARRTLERRSVAALTDLVLWGLVLSEVVAVGAGLVSAARMAPTWCLQAGLLVTFARAYHAPLHARARASCHGRSSSPSNESEFPRDSSGCRASTRSRRTPGSTPSPAA